MAEDKPKFLDKNIVAQSISESLYNKIIQDAKGLKPLPVKLRVYISNQGNDNTADGSIEKPFRTISKCIDYVYNNYYVSHTYLNTYIDFLTDYTDSTVLAFRFDKFYFVLNGNGHNVNIGAVVVADFGSVSLSNITIKPAYLNKDFNAINAHNGTIYLNNVVIDLGNIANNTPAGILSPIIARYHGYINLNTITLNLNNTIIDSIFMAYKHGLINVNYTITINGDVSIRKGLFSLEDISECAVNHTVKFIKSNTLTGKKYNLLTNSLIRLYNRGISILPETTEEGISDESSIIV